MIFCFVYDRTSKPAIILSISANTEKLEYTERKKESRFCCLRLSLHFVLDLPSASSEQQTHFRSSLLSLQKCVCCSQANRLQSASLVSRVLGLFGQLKAWWLWVRYWQSAFYTRSAVCSLRLILTDLFVCLFVCFFSQYSCCKDQFIVFLLSNHVTTHSTFFRWPESPRALGMRLFPTE